jgi:hypothetical protein
MSLTFDLECQVITEHHTFSNLNNDIQRYCEQLPTFGTWPTFWTSPVTFDLEGHVTIVLPVPQYQSDLKVRLPHKEVMKQLQIFSI